MSRWPLKEDGWKTFLFFWDDNFSGALEVCSTSEVSFKGMKFSYSSPAKQQKTRGYIWTQLLALRP